MISRGRRKPLKTLKVVGFGKVPESVFGGRERKGVGRGGPLEAPPFTFLGLAFVF